jgi:8-oxo-dGTP diphosphatase
MMEADRSDGYTRYALGFCFDAAAEHVLLIRKNRPAWMTGLLNGIGGKVEPGETFAAAMEREMCEEAGVGIPASEWTCVVGLRFPRAWVEVFAWRGSAFQHALARTDEMLLRIDVASIRHVRRDIVPNLAFLVPLARHALVEEIIEPFSLTIHGPAPGQNWTGAEAAPKTSEAG